MGNNEMKVGKYDLSLLDENSREFWRKSAAAGELPDLPVKADKPEDQKIKIFWKKFETGTPGFPTMKSHIVITHEGKIINSQEWEEYLEKGEVEFLKARQ